MILHKKHPDLIPFLDNQAIFGAYMNPKWPQKPTRSYSIEDKHLILKALYWIAFVVNRQEIDNAWGSSQAIEPTRSRIQLFDSIWWMYFRMTQPVLR